MGGLAKIDKFLDNLPVEFEPGEEVDLMIYGQSDLGFKAIVSSGILYKNEVFEDLEIGQQLKGYIKKVREDGKIDLQLYKPANNMILIRRKFLTSSGKTAG